MPSSHAFRQRLRFGFAGVAILAVAIVAASFFALGTVIDVKDAVISDYAHELIRVRELEVASEQNVSSSRAFLLTGDPQFLEKARAALERFSAIEQSLSIASHSAKETKLLEAVSLANSEHQAALDLATTTERRGGDARAVVAAFEATVLPKRRVLAEAFNELVQEKEEQLFEASEVAVRSAVRAKTFVASLGVGSSVLVMGLFLLSTRTLRRLAEADKEVRALNEDLEARVADRTRELRKVVGDLESFAYAVAHNLRAPLRAMSGFSDVALEEAGSRLDESGRDTLRRIRTAAHRMDELIQGLLTLTRMTFTNYPLCRVSGSRIVSDAVDLKGDEIRARGARVRIESAPPDFVGNPSLAGLAVGELLSNALKFVTPGAVPEVSIRGEARDGRVRLRVRDNGIGIPPEQLERIFGVFERLERAERFSGIGIGLAIARRGVELMGGTVGVSSRPGEGSEFWIDLPAAPQDCATPELSQGLNSFQG